VRAQLAVLIREDNMGDIDAQFQLRELYEEAIVVQLNSK
jgi:hypothetical protein